MLNTKTERLTVVISQKDSKTDVLKNLDELLEISSLNLKNSLSESYLLDDPSERKPLYGIMF